MEKDKIMRVTHNYSRFNSAVDVIIPYHGQYDKVTTLIDSIFKLTRSNFYRVTLVDDGSPNENFALQMQKTARDRNMINMFQTLRLEEQSGFASAIKHGWEQTDAPYVCFVNSDCRVEDPNWLRSMGDTLLELKSQNVRMVSPMANNIAGGHTSQRGGRRDLTEEHHILEDHDFLSLYCVMCHRDLFRHCGGFFKEYPLGFYEDMEFSHRMKKYGFKQAVCKTSWIVHEGSCTIKDLWKKNPEARVIMEDRNRERCIEDMK